MGEARRLRANKNARAAAAGGRISKRLYYIAYQTGLVKKIRPGRNRCPALGAASLSATGDHGG